MTRCLGLVLAALCLSTAGLTAAGRAVAASDGISCTAGGDCDAKWARARQWVLDNSKYPLSADSPTEISTVTRTKFHDPGLIVTVNRFVRADGTYTITLRAGCGLLFGACNPPIDQAQASFARYVTLSSTTPVAAPAPAVAEPVKPSQAARIPTAPAPAAPAAVVENPDDMLLSCRGGGAMTLHFAYPPRDAAGAILELSFQHAVHGARQGPLEPGQCAFSDRALRADEPTLLSVSGPIGGFGVDMHLSSDGHITAYAIKGTGATHDVLGLVTNGVLNKTDFSLHVTNIGPLTLRAGARAVSGGPKNVEP